MSKKRFIFDTVMTFQTISRTTAKELKSLSVKKERDRQNLFLAEGEKCVCDTLGAFPLETLIVSPRWIQNNNEIVNLFKDKIVIGDRRTFEIISSQGSLPEVIAVFQKNPKDELGTPVLEKGKLYLLLDEIQDPGNLGTIIRTCDWFGVYEVFASKNTVDVYSPKVVQSTMGSLSRVKVRYIDLIELVNANRNIPLIGTLLNGKSIDDQDLTVSGMLLMGNEGRGISEELKKLIDIPVTIPPVNVERHPDSLNVAVATAIILSHIKK